MNKTKIPWTDASWNPIDGCNPVSDGCKNCYAAGIAKRFWGDRKFSDVRFHAKRLFQLVKWRKPRRIFVCSMGDLFHKDISDFNIFRVVNAMHNAYQHTFILLTKRPKRMGDYFADFKNSFGSNQDKKFYGEDPSRATKNIWIGVTCENQKTADERIPILLNIPAAVRFVSVEPMLSSIDLSPWLISDGWTPSYSDPDNIGCHPPAEPLNALHWVICGTESGPKRRPAKTEWIRSLKDQCVKAGIPFFLKQREIDGKVVKMPLLDGQKWAEMPK